MQFNQPTTKAEMEPKQKEFLTNFAKQEWLIFLAKYQIKRTAKGINITPMVLCVNWSTKEIVIVPMPDDLPIPYVMKNIAHLAKLDSTNLVPSDLYLFSASAKVTLVDENVDPGQTVSSSNCVVLTALDKSGKVMMTAMCALDVGDKLGEPEIKFDCDEDDVVSTYVFLEDRK